MSSFTAGVDALSVSTAGGPDADLIGEARDTKQFPAHAGLSGKDVNNMEETVWEFHVDQNEDEKICPVCGAPYVVVKDDRCAKAYGFGHIKCQSCGMFTEV